MGMSIATLTASYRRAQQQQLGRVMAMAMSSTDARGQQGWLLGPAHHQATSGPLCND
jgi:hypothetical protein